MSEMQSARGIIKEIYADVPDVKVKIKRLSQDRGIPLDELIYQDKNGIFYWEDGIEHEDYALLDDRLFDISDAKPTYDDEDREDIEKISDGVYKVDLRYYNGGTDMNEIVEEYLMKERVASE